LLQCGECGFVRSRLRLRGVGFRFERGQPLVGAGERGLGGGSVRFRRLQRLLLLAVRSPARRGVRRSGAGGW
jgi:hypothetical protein